VSVDDARDIEGEAAWLLREFDRTPGARALVVHHLGEGAVVTLSGMRGRDAQLITLHGRPTICVRPKLTREGLRWAVLHELAEWHLQRLGYRREDVEHVAEALTAALVVPRDAYRKAVRVHGDPTADPRTPRADGEPTTWEQLAIDFSTTQTCIVLRHGEITDEPLAVVAPATARVRGREWSWPADERALRRLAREGGPGLRRAVLTDDRRRVALLAEDVEDVG
jgi:hypothetical protein